MFAQFTNPGGSVASTSTLRITGARDPRIMQVAAKFRFWRKQLGQLGRHPKSHGPSFSLRIPVPFSPGKSKMRA